MIRLSIFWRVKKPAKVCILIVYRASGLKATSAEAKEEPPERRLLKNKQCEKVILLQDSNL